MYIMELRIPLTGSICSTCKGKRSPPILAEQRKTTVLEAVSRRLKPIETGFVGLAEPPVSLKVQESVEMGKGSGLSS